MKRGQSVGAETYREHGACNYEEDDRRCMLVRRDRTLLHFWRKKSREGPPNQQTTFILEKPNEILADVLKANLAALAGQRGNP